MDMAALSDVVPSVAPASATLFVPPASPMRNLPSITLPEVMSIASLNNRVRTLVSLSSTASSSAGGVLSMTVIVLFADAAMRLVDMSRTAPALMSSLGATRSAAYMSWAGVSVMDMAASSYIVFSVAPASATLFVPPASPMRNLPSITLPEVMSIASLNDRVRTLVSSLSTAPSSAGGVLSMTVIVLFADASIWFPDVSRTAPATMSSLGSTRAAACRNWAGVSVMDMAALSDVVPSAAPSSVTWFVPSASPMRNLPSITLPGGVTSAASLNDRVRTLVSSLSTAPSSAGGVLSMTVIVLFADASIWFPDVSRTAPATMSSLGSTRAAACRNWAGVSVMDMAALSDVVPSAAPSSVTWFVPSASPMRNLPSITLPGGVTSAASLNDRVRTLVSSLSTAPSSAGGVLSMTVIVLFMDVAMGFANVPRTAPASMSSLGATRSAACRSWAGVSVMDMVELSDVVPSAAPASDMPPMSILPSITLPGGVTSTASLNDRVRIPSSL